MLFRSYFSKGDKYLGYIAVADVIKEDSPKAAGADPVDPYYVVSELVRPQPFALFCGEGGVAESDLPEVKEYLRFLTRGTWNRRSESDAVLLRVVTGWRPERIVSMNRAVLRLAVFEGFLERSVPFAVAISEAVDIAQAFGTEDSGRFVNGILTREIGRAHV